MRRNARKALLTPVHLVSRLHLEHLTPHPIKCPRVEILHEQKWLVMAPSLANDPY